jgi:peptide/nickel transport system permease protein
MRSNIIHGDTDVPWRPMLLTPRRDSRVAVPLTVLSARYHVLGTDKVGQDVLYQP